jgi:hypothetical protein
MYASCVARKPDFFSWSTAYASLQPFPQTTRVRLFDMSPQRAVHPALPQNVEAPSATAEVSHTTTIDTIEVQQATAELSPTVATETIEVTPDPPKAVPATLGTHVLQHTAPAPPTQTMSISQPGESQFQQDVDMTSHLSIAPTINLEQSTLISSPAKPELSTTMDGIEQQTREVAMVGAEVDQVAEVKDQDIAMKEEEKPIADSTDSTDNDVSMGGGETTSADREGNVVMEDDSSSSAFGSSFGSSFSSSSNSSSATSTDVDMEDAPAAAATDAATGDEVPAPKNKAAVFPGSFFLSGEAFQSALLKEIEENIVVKMEALVSQQPWFSTFRLTNNVPNWETALATQIQQLKFEKFTSGTDPEYRETYNKLFEDFLEYERNPIAWNLRHWLGLFTIPRHMSHRVVTLSPTHLDTVLPIKPRRTALDSIFMSICMASMRMSLFAAQMSSTDMELSRYGSRSLVSGSLILWRTLEQLAIKVELTKATRAAVKGRGVLSTTVQQYEEIVEHCLKTFGPEYNSFGRVMNAQTQTNGRKAGQRLIVLSVRSLRFRGRAFAADVVVARHLF